MIDQIVREGGRRMLAEALKAEVDAYIAAFADERDVHSHRLVGRNGYHAPREVLTSTGAVKVTAPQVVVSAAPAGLGGVALGGGVQFAAESGYPVQPDPACGCRKSSPTRP